METTSAQVGDVVLFHYRWVRDNKTMRTKPAMVIWTNGFLCDLHVYWGADDGISDIHFPFPPPYISPLVNGVTPGDETIDQSWSHRPGVGESAPERRHGLH